MMKAVASHMLAISYRMLEIYVDDPEVLAWRLYDILIDNLATLCSSKQQRDLDSLALYACTLYVPISLRAILACAPHRVCRHYHWSYVYTTAHNYMALYPADWMVHLLTDVWLGDVHG